MFRRANVGLILLMLPVTIGTYLARSLAWWFTLRQVKVDVDIRHSIAVEFAGQTMVFMPTGDLARIALIKEVTGTRRSAGEITATIAFQELLFMTLMGLGVLPRVASHPDIALLVIVMVLVHLLILTVLIWQPAYSWAIGVVEKVKVLRRFDPQLRSIRPAFMELLHVRVVVPGAPLQRRRRLPLLPPLLHGAARGRPDPGGLHRRQLRARAELRHLGISLIPGASALSRGCSPS